MDSGGLRRVLFPKLLFLLEITRPEGRSSSLRMTAAARSTSTTTERIKKSENDIQGSIPQNRGGEGGQGWE
jgi:hypothetical protein